MPKVGADQRLARYMAKLDPERVKQDLERRREHMMAAQRDALNKLATIEDLVRGVLSEEDVPTVQYVWYHDFARQLFALQRKFGGGKGMKREAALLVHLWKERGADEAVLKKVRFEVFGIDEP